ELAEERAVPVPREPRTTERAACVAREGGAATHAVLPGGEQRIFAARHEQHTRARSRVGDDEPVERGRVPEVDALRDLGRGAEIRMDRLFDDGRAARRDRLFGEDA